MKNKLESLFFNRKFVPVAQIRRLRKGMVIRLKNKIYILFFNQQFESEPQIALIADEKPLMRISHRVSSP